MLGVDRVASRGVKDKLDDPYRPHVDLLVVLISENNLGGHIKQGSAVLVGYQDVLVFLVTEPEINNL